MRQHPNAMDEMTPTEAERDRHNGNQLKSLRKLGGRWLSLAIADASLLPLVLPMMLIGAGQGGALGPLTASGMARVPSEQAGAASGVVNVAHQLGSSLGLGILVSVSALGSDGLVGTTLLTHRAGLAMETGTVLIALTLLLAFAFIIVRPPDNSSIPATKTP